MRRSADPAESPTAQRSAQVVFCTAVLTLEAFVVFFAALVAYGLRLAEPALVWGISGAGIALLLVTAGLARRRIGPIIGSVAQVLLIASGIVIAMMYIIGGVFAIIWVVALLLGRRIDAERAQWDQAARDEPAPGVG